MEPEAVSESMPQAEATKPQSFFSRLGGIYFSPGKTFSEIGRSPRVLVPIIVLILIGLLVGLYMAKNLDLKAMLADRMEKAVSEGRITKEQMEGQLTLVSKFAEVQLIAGAGLGSLAITLIIAGFAKLMSAVNGAENRFKAVFSVTVHAMIAISIVQSALLILVLYFKGPGEVNLSNVNSIVTSNLGAVIASVAGEDTLPKFVMKLAGWVDIFAIWLITLLAIGYSAASRTLKTATAATWLGVAYGIIALIGSAIGAFLS